MKRIIIDSDLDPVIVHQLHNRVELEPQNGIASFSGEKLEELISALQEMRAAMEVPA